MALNGFAEQHLDVNGLDTAVLTAGEGEPLLFLHGGGVLEGFDCLLPLAERFRLVIPYHPGFGGSADLPEGGTIDTMVAHYDALFEALGLAPATVVGHSFGSLIGSSFAAAHPERVRRLVLHAGLGVDVPEHPTANLGALAPGEIYGLLTSDPTVFAGRIPEPLDDAFLAGRAREGRTLGMVAGSAFARGPLEPTLAKLTMPTLILWGDADRVIPVEHAPAWQAAIPNAELRVFPGRGHLLFHEEPEAVAAIGDFASR